MLKKIIDDITIFIKERIWEIDTKGLPLHKRYGINVTKVMILALNGFKKDQCAIRSSALTYFSLLSVVPVIAVAFAISKGFGLERVLEEQITKSMDSQKEVMEYLLTFSKSMLGSTKGGVLAVISIGFLLYTVLKLFNHIEDAVNDIWNIEKSRSFIRKFTDYLSIVLIAPILLILAGTVNVYISTVLKDMSENISFFELISPVLFGLIKLIPVVIIWLLFTIMYIIMPNKKVKFTHAMFAGLFAGMAYQLIQFYYIDLQVGFSRYNAIYGSFAALPLFLMWMQFSWLVFLFGAEISSAMDNIRSYGIDRNYMALSTSKKRMLGILVLKKITASFKSGKEPPDVQELADEIKLPYQFLVQIIHTLVQSKLVSKVVGENEDSTRFQPAKDITNINFAEVVEKLDKLGENKIMINQDTDTESIDKTLDEFTELVKERYSMIYIKDL